MQRDYEHTYTLGKRIKRDRVNGLNTVLTHGWTEDYSGGRAGGRKVETIYFKTAKDAHAHAKKCGWVKR